MAYALIVDTLEDLLETCKDAESDFRLCAQCTDSAELRERYLERAERGRKFAQELQNYVAEYGGKSDIGGSVTGALHRGWLKVRGLVLGHRDLSWLSECNRREVLLLSRYKRAIQHDALPQTPRLLAQRQLYAWQHLHAQMHGLKTTLRNLDKAAA
jgi:uncharacterized protein (TIGR02284 family)